MVSGGGAVRRVQGAVLQSLSTGTVKQVRREKIGKTHVKDDVAARTKCRACGQDAIFAS